MKIEDFPEDIRPYIIPTQEGKVVYRCLGCGIVYSIDRLLYTCPDCGQILLIYDLEFDRLKKISGEMWRRIFDYRK
ncbi:MAG: threonine synthase, partial [Thermodesulfobacteriota bacterium]|nr:threonine synthase [Thermodesulfobacteriota bacterium]